MTAAARILFISKYLPHRAQDVHGVYKRLDMWVEALSEVGELEFLFYVHPESPTPPDAGARAARRLERRWGRPVRLQICEHGDPEPRSRWQAYGPSVLSMFRQGIYRAMSGSEQVAAFRQALSDSVDLVFAHRLTAMCPVLLSGRPLPPVLFDLDDIEHLSRFRKLATPPLWPGKKAAYLQLPAFWLGEWRAIRSVERTFVCSERDRRYLERQGLSGISVVPNAVSFPAEVHEPEGRDLLFLGSYSYRPNRNAARWLARDIWPRIRDRVPEATLVLAGGDQQLLDEEIHRTAGVEVLGFVEDLDALYRRIRVVCCPLLAGGGTRFKIVEAAAYGRPVVSTTVGAEGLELDDGEEILIRDETERLADACVELLQDPERANRIGRAARRAAEGRFERQSVVEEMGRLVRAELSETAT